MTNKQDQLTKGQTKALEMIERFLESGESYASITGSAGTGKSFMMSKASELLPQEAFAATAPTNKAVDVLKKFLPFGTTSLTLHKFLGLGVKYVKGVPKSYKRDDFDPWQHEDVRLVVCDEGSMLDDGLMQHIADDVADNGRKYLFVGDQAQLPPIEGSLKYSGSFDVAHKDYRVNLTEIVRQAADNPIIKVATSIRDAINEGVQPEIFGEVNEETGQGVHLLSRLEFNNKLAEVVSNPRIHEDVDYCRVVAWRNRTCRTVNKHVRKLLGEDVSRPFSEGDLVVVNSAFEEDGKIIAGTGDEVTVLNLSPTTHPLYGYKGWVVGLHNPRKGETLPKGLVCIDDEYVDELANKLEELREDALRDRSLWGAFYALKGFYIDVRPPYAITSYKSQGSTFENVFVHYKDIYENRRKITADKSFYVAVTRASKNVYILY